MKKYIQGKEDIEDVVQEVFIHLWKYRHALGTSPDAIVYKTAKQEIANFYRKNQLLFSELKEQTLADDEKNTVDELEFRQQTEKIEHLLQLVPERSKTFFLKNKVEGLSYAEIARENSISKNAVSKHVNKVLEHLKNQLGLFFFI